MSRRKPKKRTPEPWPLSDLNRIVMSARTMPGMVGSIPARHWWPALVLLMLDIDISAEMSLKQSANVFDRSTGRIRVRNLVYGLHALTLEALDALPRDRSKLLPWPKDSGKPPFCMLYRDFKTVLYRAGLPYSRLNSFVRLQVTTRRHPDIMSAIHPILDFVPINGKPQLVRARDRRRHALPKNSKSQEAASLSDTSNKPQQGFRLVAKPVERRDAPDTLRNTFRKRYKPVRLRQATPDTVAHYERSIDLINSFAGRDLTFRELTDELVEDFLSDCFERGAKPATCNHYRSDILALWRFGWKKRLTDEQPRDVPKLKVDEPLPDAWTVDELDRLVAAAVAVSGDVCGIPAGIWWPAFVLALYDTGLRFTALMQREVSDLDQKTGWLNIPASDQKQRKAQALKLHSDTLHFIAASKPEERTLLFPWPYNCEKKIRDGYREILQAAGLPTTKRDLFHKLRRTSATSVAIATDENTARDHLGHSSVSVTRRYIDRRQLKSVAAADLISRPHVASEERSEPDEAPPTISLPISQFQNERRKDAP